MTDSLSPVGSSIDTSAAAATQALQKLSGRHHGHHGARKAAMGAAEQLLGMSAQDLRTALQSGQSITDIAAGKGVSKDQLISAMASAIGTASPNTSADAAQQIATRIATMTPTAFDTAQAQPTAGRLNISA